MQNPTSFLNRVLAALLTISLFSCEGCVIRIESSDGTSASHSHSISFSRHSAVATQEVVLEIAAADVLILNSSYGDIEASTMESGFRVVGEITASAETKEQAEIALRHATLRAERNGSRVQIVVEKGKTEEVDMDKVSFHASYKAFAPAGVGLEAKTSSGKISADGAWSDAKLVTGYGKIYARGIQGEVSARSSSGNIEIEQVKGSRIEAKTGYGTVTASHLDAEEVSLRSSSGDIEATHVEGKKVSVESSYGRLALSHVAGHLTAKTSSGRIEIAALQGSVEANSGYGSVKIEGTLDGVAAKSSSGSVSIQALPGSRTASPWTLSSGYGEISLHLPSNFSCDLDAQTGYGSIHMDFPITLPAGYSSSKNRIAGAIGQGGGKVSLKTSSGKIQIRNSGN